MATRIGALHIDLNLNTAKFIQELDKSRTKSTIFGVAVGNVLSSIAISAARMAADVATALPRAFLSATEAAEQMGVLAQRTNIATETLSALKHQAQLSDVSFDSLTTSISRFSRNIGEAAAGNKKQQETFRALGVDLEGVKAGTVSVEDALFGAIDTLSKTENQFRKLQLGTAAFGKGFAEIVPLVNEGRAGFSAAREEAEKLGLVISGSTAKAADQFNDNLDRLKLSLTGVANEITKALLPGFLAMQESLVRFATEGGKVQAIGQGISGALQGITKAVLFAAEIVTTGAAGFALLAEEIASARLEMAKFVGIGDIDKLTVELEIRSARTDTVGALRKSINDLQNEVDTAFTGATAGLPSTARIVGEQTGAAFGNSFNETLKAQMAETKALVERLSLQPKDIEFPDLVGPLVEGKQKVIEYNQELFALSMTYDALKEKSEAWNVELEGLQLSWDAFAKTTKDLDLIDPSLAKVATRTGEISDKASEAKDRFQELAHTLSSGFEDAILSGKGLRATLDGILQDIGRIILRSTITGPNGILGSLLSGLGGAVGGIFGGGATAGAAGGLANLGLEGRASGGPVMAGRTYLVGEHGPEQFSPSVSGTIIPGVGRNSQVINVDARQSVTINTGARPEEVIRALQLVRQSAVAEAVAVIVQRQLRT